MFNLDTLCFGVLIGVNDRQMSRLPLAFSTTKLREGNANARDWKTFH